MKKILVINAHPRDGSLSDALAQEYIRGTEEVTCKVEYVKLRDLSFDPILRTSYRNNELESDLKMMQEKMLWCDHLVIVTPVWWLSMPALLKGFIDRVITPGFAFKYKKGSLLPFPQRLLKGRSARVIYTQGGPRWVSWTIAFDSFWKSLKYGTLVFCGFGPVRRTYFSKITSPSEQRCKACLRKVFRLGAKGK